MQAAQRGGALLMALVILLVLSLLAVSGMQGSLLQERMSSAQRDGLIALEVAEAGARDAERWIDENVVTLTQFDGTGGLYDATDDNSSVHAPDPYKDDTWTEARTRAAGEVDGITPRFFIEYLGRASEVEQLTDGMITGYRHDSGAANAYAFRAVVRAAGPGGRGQRIVEVFYTRQI